MEENTRLKLSAVFEVQPYAGLPPKRFSDTIEGMREVRLGDAISLRRAPTSSYPNSIGAFIGNGGPYHGLSLGKLTNKNGEFEAN